MYKISLLQKDMPFFILFGSKDGIAIMPSPNVSFFCVRFSLDHLRGHPVWSALNRLETSSPSTANSLSWQGEGRSKGKERGGIMVKGGGSNGEVMVRRGRSNGKERGGVLVRRGEE